MIIRKRKNNKMVRHDLLAYYKILSASQRFGLGLASIIWDSTISLKFKKKIVVMLETMSQALIKLKEE